jgi:hypothetical protein
VNAREVLRGTSTPVLPSEEYRYQRRDAASRRLGRLVCLDEKTVDDGLATRRPCDFAITHSAFASMRPLSPFTLLDAAPQTGPLFRKRTPAAGYPARIRKLLRWQKFLPRIEPTAAAVEQLVGAEVKCPGRARTGGCACACVLRRRSRSRPPARSAARPAHPLLSADPSLARCALPPAAFR